MLAEKGAGQVMRQKSRCATFPLTSAEARVIRLIANSKTNRQIASELCISPATVKRHVENIFRKLHLRSRIEAAIYALTLDDCPVRGQTRCPLDLWRRKRENTEQNWAS
jgi:DNA-binding NarL/FixJ family response regulator